MKNLFTLVAASVAVGVAIAAETPSVFSPDAFTVLNIAPFQPGSERQLAEEMVEYRARTGNDVVLYSLTLNPEGFPAMKKAEYLIGSYRKLRTALKGSGVRLGVLMQATLGHWPRVDKDEEQWMRSITIEGKTKRFCPLDPGYAAYIREVVTLLAKEDPCFLLIDDDVHASGSFGVECFCARHVDRFNRENGTSYTPDALRAAVAASKPGDGLCTAFEKMQRDFVKDVVDIVRGALDAVDAKIPGGACMPYREHRYAAGTARRMAAKGQSAVLRIDNSLYGHRTLTTFVDSIAYTLALTDYCRDLPYLLDESDSCPHNRWALSATLLDMKLQAAAFAGLKGSKLWYCNAHKGRFPISRAYTDRLAEHRGIHSAIVRAVADAPLAGPIVPVIGGREKWHPSMQFESYVGAGDWATAMAGRFGIPFTCRCDLTADGLYLLGGADTVGKLSDDELRGILGRRVLVDAPAAEALAARGFGKLLGVKVEKKPLRYNSERNLKDGSVYPFSKQDGTPLLTPVAKDAVVLTHLCYTPYGGSPDVETVAPASVLSTNELGGRVLVTAFPAAGFPPWLAPYTDMRKDWFLRMLGHLGWNGWSALADQDLLMLERRPRDGSVLLALFNTSFDPLESVKLHAPTVVKGVEKLSADGTWTSVPWHQDKDVLTVDCPLACSNALFLRINGTVTGGRRPVFVNYDDTHFVHSRTKFGVEMTADEMRRMVRQYKGTDVTDLLFCISGRIADVPNSIKESWIDKYHQTNENGYAVNYTENMYARAAHEQYEVQKVDRVAIWLDEARKCGIRPWLSFRMNDCHNNFMPTNFLHPEFFHRHPEYRRIRHRSPSLYFDRCFDYAFKPIRDRELGYIGEMLRRYDTDGVEIDWMREPYCFAPGQEDQTVMTGFMREVRRLVDGAAKRLGHPVKVLARVPADPETALRFGFDVVAWADEKLVDVLVPCPRWETTDNEIATDLWKRLLRGTGVQLAPGVEIRIVRERPFYVSVEQLMGAAAWHYSAGADGFYLYNYFDDPSWKEGDKVGFGYWAERNQAPETVAPAWGNQVKWLRMIGHPDKVLAAPRDHVLTYHDIVPLWGSREHALPVKLGKNWLHYFRLATGTVPPGRQLMLRLGVVGDAKLRVFANSRPCVPIGMEKCEPAFTSAPLMTFSVPEFSEDSVVVEVCPDAPVEITFLDLQVRPGESVPAVLAEFAKSDEHPRNSEGDVIRLRDGRLLVVYSHFYKDPSSKFADGGSDDSSAELVLTESADGGKTWSKMRTAVRKDKGALNVMSASFLRLGDGRLALFYLNKVSSADCRPVMVVSSDEGKTWSAPVDCVSEREKGYYILNNARAVRLKSGRIALPLAYHPFDGKRHEEGALLLCALSDDDGRTWRLSSDRRRGTPPSGAKKLSLQEPGLVELKDGRLMMYARSNERRQWRLFSTDNGEHWTEPEPVTEYATTTFSPVTYARLADGRLVVVFNDGSAHADAAPTGLERRWPLAVGVSSDEGKTWKTKVLEPDDPKGTVHACYTATREIDGRLVLVYCHRDMLATTRVVSVPLDWLP